MASAAKTISLIGFAARARKLLFGSFSCEKGVRSGKARLILADEGLSARSMKDVHNMCEYYSVSFREYRARAVKWRLLRTNSLQRRY